jgi:hypothetical protein
VSGVADKKTGSAKYQLTVLDSPHVFGWKRHMIRPFALEIAASDFAFAAVIALALSAWWLSH